MTSIDKNKSDNVNFLIISPETKIGKLLEVYPHLEEIKQSYP